MTLRAELDLLLELLRMPLVAGELGPDCLERDALVQLEILGGVDLAHAAFGQAPLDAKAAGDDLHRATKVRSSARTISAIPSVRHAPSPRGSPEIE